MLMWLMNALIVVGVVIFMAALMLIAWAWAEIDALMYDEEE